MPYGLSDNVIERLQKVFENCVGIDKVILFGSRAKGNYKEGSDIDLAAKGYDYAFDEGKVRMQLDELNLPYEIDLINYHSIKEPALTAHIDRAGIELYSRWREIRASELCELIGGGTPKTTVPEYWGGNIPWLSVTDFNTGRKYCFDADKKITEKGLKESSTKILKKGQVIISARGTVGVISMLGRDMAFNQSSYGIDAKKELTSNNFLYYLLKNNVPQFISNSYGAVFDTITTETFEQIKVLLPPLPEQKSIAEVLGSLDDKIDLLHRQNKTLEQLAEALFRQWFAEEAEESWEEKTLRDIADHYKENVSPSKDPDTIFYHYSLPAFDEGKNPVIEIGKEILSNKYKVIPNSILVSKLNPRFPRIWALYGNDVESNSICSTEFQIVKPKHISYFGFIYCFLSSYRVTQELTNSAGGTSGSHQRVNPDDIFNLSFLFPSKKLIEKFDSITKENWIKIKENTKQIKTLQQTRDLLLPKLLSGEVRIKN